MPVYKDEQRGTFFCSFYYTDWTGEKKKKTKRGFKLKRDAQAFERSFLEQTQGEPTMLFSALVDLYLADIRTRLKPSTLYGREKIIQDKYLPFFGKLRLDQITPAHIRKWQNALIEQGFKETYLRSLSTSLSTIFNFAVRYYNLKENPCAKAGHIGKMKADEMLFWTRQEYAQFIKQIEEHTMQHLGFQLLYWTGMRIGEMMALTVGDIDLRNKTLSITKSYQRIQKQDVITEPKTQKSKRVIFLPDFLCTELEEHIARMYDVKPTDRLLPCGKMLFRYHLELGAERAGVKRIRLHDFRHSHASLLIELGFSPLLIAERLGHENIERTLNTYSHLYPNKQAELIEKLEKLDI